MNSSVSTTGGATVIGLGTMGTALASTFVSNGVATTVWNRSAARAVPLVARGAVSPATIADAVKTNKLVIVCLLDYSSVYEALEPAKAVLAQKVIVNLTNGTPAQARQMATWIKEQGADYVDGGIMAIPPMIGQPSALLLYSGRQSAFDQYKPVLDLLGTSRFMGEDPGLAPLYDISLLIGMYGMFAGTLQAITLAATENVKAGELMSLLLPWMQAMMGALTAMAVQVDAGDYYKEVTSNLKMQAAGFANLVEACKEQGVNAELMLPMNQLMQEGVKAGYGTADISALMELLKKPVTLQ